MIQFRELLFGSEFSQREALLSSRGLAVPRDDGVVVGGFDGDRLVGTASLIGAVIQAVAVDRSREGEGVAASLISRMLSMGIQRGYSHLFLFTKPEEVRRFSDLGFETVDMVDGAALLEWGRPDARAWSEAHKVMAVPGASCAVVNCNPFTLGHRFLLERASGASTHLFVMVVQEDRSLFPFEDRYDLVRRGLADLKNVTVLPGGPYVISAATFPTYFIKEEGKAATVHAELDAHIFGTVVAPALGVTRRWVGSEPLCPLTSQYNRTLAEVLPPLGVDVEEVGRLSLSGSPVSASLVRSLLERGELDAVRPLVPDVTWAYLTDGHISKE